MDSRVRKFGRLSSCGVIVSIITTITLFYFAYENKDVTSNLPLALIYIFIHFCEITIIHLPTSLSHYYEDGMKHGFEKVRGYIQTLCAYSVFLVLSSIILFFIPFAMTTGLFLGFSTAYSFLFAFLGVGYHEGAKSFFQCGWYWVIIVGAVIAWIFFSWYSIFFSIASFLAAMLSVAIRAVPEASRAKKEKSEELRSKVEQKRIEKEQRRQAERDRLERDRLAKTELEQRRQGEQMQARLDAERAQAERAERGRVQLERERLMAEHIERAKKEQDIMLKEKLKRILSRSTKVRIDMVRDALQLDPTTFNQLIWEWAEILDFKIDGDYIVFDREDLSEHVAHLDEQFQEWDNDKTKKL